MSNVDPACPKTCVHCGKRVKRTDGFFRSWPVPTSLHHECVGAYHWREK